MAGNNTFRTRRFKIRTGYRAVQNPYRERFKIRTGIKTTYKNNPLKQQKAVVAGGQNELEELLRSAGFDEKTASTLASQTTTETAKQQIDWLALRNPSTNPLGMLRTAIEKNWPAPRGDEKVRLTELPNQLGGEEFVRRFYASKAGSTQPPSSNPTRVEVQLADQFIQRLLATWPDRTRIPEWGSSFGSFVQRQQEEQRSKFRTFSICLRMFGDGYLERHSTDHRRFIDQLNHARLTTERESKKAAWYEYLRESFRIIRVNEPDQFEAFLQHRTDTQREVAVLMRKTPITIAEFDPDHPTSFELEDFQKFFRSSILAFDRWMITHNQRIA